MGDMKIKTIVAFTAQCELTEGELRALDALVGYGFKAFLETFYTRMGKAYMEPYADDLKALFDKVETLRPQIHEINKARQALGLPVPIKGG